MLDPKKYNLKLLENLYLIHSPSKQEDEMSQFLQKTLKARGVRFEVDAHGQIFNFSHQGQPLLSAHMDQVQKDPCREVLKNLAGGAIWYSATGLGADDKNGIWVVLELISRNPQSNFVFSVCEECGGLELDQLLAKHKEKLKSIPYGLVFDRKGVGDIIGTDNCYCVKAMEVDVEELGQSFGYAAVRGVFSDADRLNTYMSCVNLSCGYFNAHGTDEYTLLPALFNAVEFGDVLLDGLSKKKYVVPEPRVWARWTPPPVKYGRGWSGKRSLYQLPAAQPFVYGAGGDDVSSDILDVAEFYCPNCYQDLHVSEISELPTAKDGTFTCPECLTDAHVSEILGADFYPISEALEEGGGTA